MKQPSKILGDVTRQNATVSPGDESSRRIARRFQGNAPRAVAWLALVGLLLAGCFVPRRLEPASGERLAEAKGLGLSMKADGEAWVGASSTEQHSVPVWVEIANRGDTTVRVRYSDWAMVAGERAVPAIDPHPGMVLPPPTGNALPGSYAYSDRSWLAPVAFRPLHRGLVPRATYPGQTGYRWQAGRMGVWSPYGRSAVLTAQPIRTWDMVRLAVGEGELEPGQTMAGFVYFPRSLLRERQLGLTWMVHDTEGRPLGALGAEFRVLDRGSADEEIP